MIELDAVALFPVGYRFMLVIAAVTKRVLLGKDLTPAQRLDLLERLNDLVDKSFTSEMLAMIEPASDVELQMYDAAASLDGDNKRCLASFDMLTRSPVFDLFLQANPSLVAAIETKPGPARVCELAPT